jgi:hypothetical protein
MGRQLRLEYAGRFIIFEEAQEGRSAENGNGGGTAQANGDVYGVEGQRTQRWGSE